MILPEELCIATSGYPEDEQDKDFAHCVIKLQYLSVCFTILAHPDNLPDN
jgi:hypothetical protein